MSRLSWWTVQMVTEKTNSEYRKPTSVKHELQLNKLHVNDIRTNIFMLESHLEVFDLDKIPLQRIF